MKVRTAYAVLIYRVSSGNLKFQPQGHETDQARSICSLVIVSLRERIYLKPRFSHLVSGKE